MSMSTAVQAPDRQLEADAPVEAPPPSSVPFHYTQTDSFVAVLNELGASLLVSTYQANKLLVARAQGSGLSMLVRTFERPMGLAVNAQRLTIGARNQIWFLRNAPDIAPRIEPMGTHDACFLPRSSHVTGDIGIHEIAWANAKNQESAIRRAGSVSDRSSQGVGLLNPDPCLLAFEDLWIVNTRFSCLSTLDPNYSFVPCWRPPFITALAAEDRCHLNGLAIVDGRPKFVTTLGETDTPNGWRSNKGSGGCVMDVDRNEVIARGLSMPHSPRWHDNRLWLLESGTGRLLLLDLATGQGQVVAELPGFARGLAFIGPFAFVGLSRIRPTSAMDGVPLAERREQLNCGVAVVNLSSGQTIGFLEFQTAVEEIFDVQLLPGLRFPEVVGFQKETVHHTFIIPPDADEVRTS